MTTSVRIQIQFFAALRETLGRERLELELPAGIAEPELRAAVATALAVTPGQREDFLRLLNAPNVRLAVNQSLVHSADLTLADGDELAFLPPVTGG